MYVYMYIESRYLSIRGSSNHAKLRLIIESIYNLHAGITFSNYNWLFVGSLTVFTGSNDM
jgi:hypothetical protein